MMDPNYSQQLTPRQSQILASIAQTISNFSYSPTIGEIAGDIGISRTTAYEHIGELRKKGLLSSLPGKARSLTLTSKAQRLLENLGCSDCDAEPVLNPRIKIAGTVAAGTPIEAIEDRSELSLADHFSGADDIFALKVRGDSMIDEDIKDGDYVICKRSSTANNGDIAVAIVDEDNATLKRFYKEPDSVRLQPCNDDYNPIYSRNCRIEGIVVGLVRKL